MGENCDTPACKLLDADMSETFEDDEAAQKAKAQGEIANTKARMGLSRLDPNKIDPVEERSPNVHIDYLDDDIRNAIIDNLAKIRDDMLADNPAKPLEPDESARKQYLSGFFKEMPQTYFFSGVAEGLTEKQIIEKLSKVISTLVESGYDPAVAIDYSVSPAPIMQKHDERLDKNISPTEELALSNENRIKLINKVLPDITRKLIDALRKTLPIAEGEKDLRKARYNVGRFNAITGVQLNLLMKLHADKAYVENSYSVNKKDTNQVIHEYFKEAALLLASCAKKPEDKQLVLKEMEQIL